MLCWFFFLCVTCGGQLAGGLCYKLVGAPAIEQGECQDKSSYLLICSIVVLVLCCCMYVYVT